ncbi:CheA signal transduction histidine kinase [Tolypothrix sp. NIES-4075]|uniref:hybrid sensor histidine kinase/response regulator n=1 Tax=Tolypothrix sp. NIES-4075 TaxID=2005459 RepID=UPI000B5C3347|nr:hybrid sensor histidine kinase/response regulator [Tolypothrix sp. NIES-4075]GAX40762.1 CheA signal transduction histidine kinase [Tolypothrix sp. NIES-4075]
MITEAEIRKLGYIYFLAEAPELLQTIEQELFSFLEGYSTVKVHNLMRATHTLKGGSANVGLEVIQMIAHSLEDVFQALYSPDVVINTELQTLLLQAYECLRLAVTAEVTQNTVNHEELLQRATSVFAQLQEKLGDAFGAQTHIPTSEELGFDIVQSIFEVGVLQRLESIAEAIKNTPDDTEFINFLRSEAEVFFGLAESLNLPGLAELAQTILTALEVNPTQVHQIAEIALADLQQAQEAVLAGDRTRGGEPSPALQKLSLLASDRLQLTDVIVAATDDLSLSPTEQPSLTFATNSPATSIAITPLRREIQELYKFLTQKDNTKNKPLQPTVAKFYLKVIRYILGWFNHKLQIPEKELCLALLIPKSEVENPVTYVENWLNDFFDFVQDEEDSQSICIYRQGIILTIILAVAKFQYCNDDLYSNILVITKLQNKINKLTKQYKKIPPITNQQKNCIDIPKLQKLLEIKEIHTPTSPKQTDLLETIWGEEIYPTFSNEFVATQLEEVNIDDSENTELLALSQQEFSDIPDFSTEISPQLAVSQQEVSDIPDFSTEISPEIEEKSQHFANKNSRQASFVRVDVEGLQRLNYLAGELLIYQQQRTLQDEQLKEKIEQLYQQIVAHQTSLEQLREMPLPKQKFALQNRQNFASVDFDSLEMDEYTEFHLGLHLALEETLQLQESTESLDLLLNQSIQIHDKKQRMILGIIDNLVEARMLPLGNVLNRFPQMVQNLGNVYGKVVKLKFTGTEVLVDKAIAEKLYDPLLHLVRNAFDHGIEPVEVRRDRQKAEHGVIEICAYHQGSQTIIEVRDDGEGLNLEKIQNKAIELDIISADDKARDNTFNSTKSVLLELIFSPGFTTAGKVNEISGRGMGLDIVRSQLQALNGEISVQSLPEQGTTFTLKIPFSMTTDRLMLVQAGSAVYALLLDSIEKIFIPSAEQIKEFEGKKVLHWNTSNNEQMVSLRQLSELISYNNSFVSANTIHNQPTTLETRVKTNPVLLLRQNQELFGLEVDQIIGEQELVIRPLGNAIAPPKYVYGCSRLANGSLILVIDAALLLKSGEMQANLDVMTLPTAHLSKKEVLPLSNLTVQSREQLNPSANTNHPSQSQELNQNSPKVILIVDDAISLRQTLSLTLQKAGYGVLQAENGVEALEQLQQHPEIQVVISDLEMPRMNGFELLSNIRQNPKLIKKPVVVLTSRSATKHRQLAQALGANAYLTKPYLENEFLSTVESLISTNTNNFTELVVHN